MDIKRKETKKRLSPKVIVMGIGGAVIFAYSVYALAFSSSHAFTISSDMILTDSVQQGELVINVRGIGVLAPKDVRWLATNVSGKVERVYAKAGAHVKQGDLIMQLSNPQLQQSLEETRWELDELLAQTQALKVSLETQVLDQEAQVINEKLNYERSMLTLNAQDTLIQQGVNAVSKIDHQATQIEVEQNMERWQLAIKRLQKQKENVEAQLQANLAKVERMRKTLERAEQQVKNLDVRASIDAIIQVLPVELGQQVNAGNNLARLAKRDEFIAELRIPEIHIQDVTIGQSVTLDTRNSQVQGVVQRIDPSVNNGSVQVDVEFISGAPSDARPELTVEGVIEIVKIPNALYVKRPMFARSYNQGHVYLIDRNSKIASKHSVNFGKASTTHIEIKNGLRIGQEIIISDASSFESHSQISIN